MHLYGYTDDALSMEEISTKPLAEVTLCATSVELRNMAEFFIFCASQMEQMGSDYGHVHLADQFEEFEDSPHFVVMSSHHLQGNQGNRIKNS